MMITVSNTIAITGDWLVCFGSHLRLFGVCCCSSGFWVLGIEIQIIGRAARRVLASLQWPFDSSA
jgi:hypothetical protein